jgi:hypothetical protein
VEAEVDAEDTERQVARATREIPMELELLEDGTMTITVGHVDMI